MLSTALDTHKSSPPTILSSNDTHAGGPTTPPKIDPPFPNKPLPVPCSLNNPSPDDSAAASSNLSVSGDVHADADADAEVDGPTTPTKDTSFQTLSISPELPKQGSPSLQQVPPVEYSDANEKFQSIARALEKDVGAKKAGILINKLLGQNPFNRTLLKKLPHEAREELAGSYDGALYSCKGDMSGLLSAKVNVIFILTWGRENGSDDLSLTFLHDHGDRVKGPLSCTGRVVANLCREVMGKRSEDTLHDLQQVNTVNSLTSHVVPFNSAPSSFEKPPVNLRKKAAAILHRRVFQAGVTPDVLIMSGEVESMQVRACKKQRDGLRRRVLREIEVQCR